MIEAPSRIEPCFFEDAIPRVLADLVTEIQQEASQLGRDLHPGSSAELADLVRIMNCYYSNLIEGHDTRPLDIEKALVGAELEEEKRPLALEARAHVMVHRAIDIAHSENRLPSPTSIEFIRWVHRSFYEHMPDEFKVVKVAGGGTMPIVGGRFRTDAKENVQVGRHVPPSSDRVEDFMRHFEKRYGYAAQWPSMRVIATASAHHRLNYIHPFVDGNGRVSRLMSHAMALKAGIGGAGLWSISRGLARGLRDGGEYKRMMDMADSPRRGDRDGRGNLSEAALRDFCEWFLSVVLDQIRFTRAAFKLETLETRYCRLIRDLGYDKSAEALISAVLRYGQLERGAAAVVLRTSERTARNVLKKLVDEGFLKSVSPKTPVRIAFPLEHRERFFPSLFSTEEIAAPEPPRTSFS